MEQTIAIDGRLDLSVKTLRRVVEAIQAASKAVYDPETGVTCPVCGMGLEDGNMGVRRTCGWCGGERERYHVCPVCGVKFKSVEGCGCGG